MRTRLIIALAFVSGCQFNVDGTTPPPGSDDAAVDLTVAPKDAPSAEAAVPDLLVENDLAMDAAPEASVDLLVLPDLTVGPTVDLAVPQDGPPSTNDLTMPPGDLAMPAPDMTAPPPDLLVLPDLLIVRDLLALPAPTLSSATPSKGGTMGGTSITLTGTNFLLMATVTVDGKPCTVTNVTATTITCTTASDAGALGPVAVVVTNPDGQSASGNVFSYYASSVSLSAVSSISLAGSNTSPSFVAIGQMDSDKINDLVVTDSANTNGVWVLLGKGDGTFPTKMGYATGGTATSSAALGDFDGDTFLDVLVANYGSTGNGNAGVLRGNGDGTLKAVAAVGVQHNPIYVVAGKFNTDKFWDAAVANYSSGTVTTLVGQMGSPFLGGPQNPATADQPIPLALGLLNNDAVLDLVVGNSNNNTGVDILLGKTDNSGQFSAAVNYAACSNFVRGVAVADFTGDGKNDVAVSCGFGDTVKIIPGKGDGTLDTAATVTTNFASNTHPWGIAVADFNGDAIPDLAAALNASNQIALLIGAGNGTFPSPYTKASCTAPTYLAAGLLDGDARPDVAVACTTVVGIHLNTSQ